jgi:hypothetical protein
LVKLLVNGVNIKLNEFADKLINNTIIGMMKSLHGVESLENANIKITDKDTKLKINGINIPTNLFVVRIIRNTTLGMVSSLKGIETPVNNLELSLKSGQEERV